MKKRRVVAILICAVMLVALAACNGSTTPASSSPPASSSASPAPSSGGASPAPAPSSGSSAPAPAPSGAAPAGSAKDTLTLQVFGDTGSLDPMTLVTPCFEAAECIQEPLWDVDENNNVIMLLAESVDKVSDTEWTVHLRQGVTFSNGDPFTADDVIFSIQLHANGGASSQPRVQNVDVANTKAIDANTVDLKWLDFNVANWTILSETCIYDQKAYDPQTAGINPIGTGPYTLTEYVPNSYIKLTARDDYWGGTPAIKYLNFQVLNESAQVVNALDTNMVDQAYVSLQDVDHIKTLSQYRVDSRETGNYIILGFNLGVNSVMFQNVDARAAICHAIDRQALVDIVFLGQGKVMTGPTPDICFDWEPRFDNIDPTYSDAYNVDLAKQLAQSSGIAGKTILLMTDGTTQSVSLAQMLQNMIQQIGVTVQINNYDPATSWTMTFDPTSKYDISIGAGIAPNRRVGDQLVNGVRYNPAMTADNAFPDNKTYLQISPSTMTEPNDQTRSDNIFKVLGLYEQNVLSYGLLNPLQSVAFSTAIDPASIVYSVTTGNVRAMDLRFAS